MDAQQFTQLLAALAQSQSQSANNLKKKPANNNNSAKDNTSSSLNLKRKNTNENNKPTVAKKLSFDGALAKKRTDEPTHALVYWTEEMKFSVVKYSSIQSECIQGF